MSNMKLSFANCSSALERKFMGTASQAQKNNVKVQLMPLKAETYEV